MAKSENQKLKLLYIIKILSEQTDETHYLSTQKLIDLLIEEGIKAERKTIYSDITQLQNFGYQILNSKVKDNGGYAMVSREFEIAELKLLVDAVQASKFITLKKSKDLIEKIEHLASSFEAKLLQRQVYVANRIKTANESIYENVDYLHKAIWENQKILFQYFEWTVSKQMKFKKEGKKYCISPYALTFSEENYYLIGYDELDDMIKHYRVDKMMDIKISGENRTGEAIFEHFDIASYSNQTFGMFGGRVETVGIQFSNRLIGVVLDRFGTDITIRTREEENFSIRVKVTVSNQFFGWISGLGTEARIISPTEVAMEYAVYLGGILWNYK